MVKPNRVFETSGPQTALKEHSGIIEAVKRSLIEWGVRSDRNSHHRDFEKRAIESALRCFQFHNFGMQLPRIVCAQTPQDLMQAIKHVLKCELDEGRALDTESRRLIQDAMKLEHGEPYYISEKGNNRKKPGLTKYTLKDLDPLSRFQWVPCSELEYCFGDFSDVGYCLGMAFEAIVASYAASNIACMSCKALKTLSWCGGKKSSWCDMECRHCRASYEIKSKKDAEAISKVHRFKSGGLGGSFEGYCRQRATHPQCKHNMVFISRQATMIRSKGFVGPVEVAETQKVLPRLSMLSFADPCRNDIPMKSSFNVNQNTRMVWFYIPWFRFDACKSAKDLFNEAFPGHWDRLYS